MTRRGYSSKYRGGCGCALGGAESFCGGLDDLVDDTNKTYSRAKETMIKKLATELNSSFNMGLDVNAEGPALVKQLQSKIPNPKNKTTLPADKETLHKICQKLGNTINGLAGDVIDMTASDEAVCTASIEFINTLGTSMHAEFLAIARDVEKSIKNIKLLDSFLEQNFKMLEAAADAQDDPKKKMEFNKLKDYHAIVHKELMRQLAMLENVLTVNIKPIDRDLITAIAENKDFKNLINDIKDGKPEEVPFNDKVAFALNGFKSLAATAVAVKTALKNTGLSLEQYKTSKSLDELKENVYALMKNVDAKNTDSIQKFLKAADLIYNNYYLHDDIIKYMEENKTMDGAGEKSRKRASRKRTRGGMDHGGDDDDNREDFGNAYEGGAVGGATGDDWKKKLDKRIKAQGETKKLLEKNFLYRIGRFYDSLFNATNNIYRKIGNTIPLSEDLSRFIKAFEYLELLERPQIGKALMGLDTSTTGIDTKNRINSYLREISLRAQPLASGPAGEYFNDIKNAVDGISDTIATYSTKFNTGRTVTGDLLGQKDSQKLEMMGLNEESDEEHGGDESTDTISASMSASESGAVYPVFDNVFGSDTASLVVGDDGSVVDVGEGAVGGADGGAVDISDGSVPTKNVHSQQIKKTVANMKYYYKIAKIRSNLQISAKELTAYQENYEELVGDAVASSIEKSRLEMDKLSNIVDQVKVAGVGHPGIGPNWNGSAARFGNFHADRIANAAENNTHTITGTILYNGTAIPATHVDAVAAAIKGWYKHKHEAVQGLYKVAEAVDLYLAAITNGLANNPEEIKSMTDILDSVKVIVKFFTEKTGDDIAKFFDMFGTDPATSDDANVTTIWNLAVDGYIAKIAAAGVDIGDGYSPIPAVKNDANKTNMVDEVLKQAKRAVSNFQALKNVVSVFTSIGRMFGGEDMNKKFLLTPVQIYENLTNYLYIMSIHNGMGEDIARIKVRYVCGMDDGVNNTTIAAATATTAAGVPTPATIGPRAVETPYDKLFAQKTTPGVGPGAAAVPVPYPDYYRYLSTYQNYYTNNTNKELVSEDFLFVDILKAMAGKVLTVVKTYTLFKKPLADRAVIYRNPVRMMLGGAEEAKVVDDAFELYVRLPLLAEFYKNVFGMDQQDPTTVPGANVNERIITFAPEFDNVWHDLITIVFDSARYVSEGVYSRTHVNDIVNAVNKIYNVVKAKTNENITQATVLEFIAEINRRYGIVQRAQVTSYLDEVNKMRNGNTYNESYSDIQDNNTDFEILPDESDPQYKKLAPSDRYFKGSLNPMSASQALKNAIDHNDMDIVKNFRYRIDYLFNSADLGSSGDMAAFSFSETLKAAKNELSRTKESDKLVVVMKSIQNSNKVTGNNKYRLTFFHETVHFGLATVQTLVDYVRNRIVNVPLTAAAHAAAVAAAAAAVPPTVVPARLTVDNMVKLLHVIANDSQGLITIRFDGGGIHLDASNLISVVDSQIQFIKYILDKYRIDIDKAILKNYDTVLAGLENDVNVYLKDSKDGIDGIGKWSAKLHDEFNAGKLQVAATQITDNYLRASVNGSVNAAGVNGVPNRAAANSLDKFYVWQNNGTLVAPGAAGVPAGVVPLGLPHRLTNQNHELINNFNTTLTDVIDKFYDNSINKIYVNLVEPLTNGVLGNAINNSSYDAADGTDFINDFAAGLNGNDTHILYKSVAFAIQKILTLRDKNDVNRIRVVATLAEVTGTIKDKMRAYLPVFIKKFDMIASKALYYKSLIDANFVTGNGTANLIAQLNKLVQACKNVKATLVSVHRELDDQPQYLETYRNSLEEYRAQYDKLAFTPLSSLYPAIDSAQAADVSSLPVTPAGGAAPAVDFKYDFGVRGVLYGNDNLSNSHVIFDEYNTASETLSKVESDKYQEYVKNQLKFVRMIHENVAYKQTLTDYFAAAGIDNVAVLTGAGAGVGGAAVVPVYSCYQNGISMSKVLEVTETVNQDKVLDDFSKTVAGTTLTTNKGNRVDAQVMNILDLNVMPINVNALMRDVPLVNIYNYSYTFDKIVSQCYNMADIPRVWTPINNTADSFVQLMVNPYKVVAGTNAFYRHIGRVMVGVSDMNLGRPRFIADQLWNKVLVQNQYSTNTEEFNSDPRPPAVIAPAASVINTGKRSNVPFRVSENGVVNYITVQPTSHNINANVIRVARSRFDSVFIRNIYFITNLQRMLMKLMRDEFVEVNDPVAAGNTLLDRRMTEYDPTNQYSSQPPYQA